MAAQDKNIPTDLDIMMFLDGELHGPEADTVSRFLAGDKEAAAKGKSLGQISQLLQGAIELDTDDAADKLGGLWAGIDKAIHANGASKESPEVSADDRKSASEPKRSAAQRAEDRATDALVAKTKPNWMGGWQSHIMTGAFVAVAVAVVMIAMRPDPAQLQPTARQPAVAIPVQLASEAPEVEELEVYEGTGVIMTVPGDEGDESASTVIWISSDTNVVEDPI